MDAPHQQSSNDTNTTHRSIVKIGVIIAAAVVSVIIVIFAAIFSARNLNDFPHKKILTHLNNGAYAEALTALEELEAEEEINDQLRKYRYEIGMGMIDNGDYLQAVSVFEPITEYLDVSEQIILCNYNIVLAAVDNGQYAEALTLLEGLGEYKDSAALISKCQYGLASSLMQQGAFQDALPLFQALGQYEDSAAMVIECNFGMAAALLDKQNFLDALNIFTSIQDKKDCAQQIKQCRAGLLGDELINATVGDYVTFGSYEQDCDISNGSEEIEWKVLARDGSRILVISKYALDCRLYHDTYEPVTWENSSIRKWLNNNFLQTAFADWQQDMIPTVTVYNEDNRRYGTMGGDSTQDQIFLLSISEANRYFRYDSQRLCWPTIYALTNGLWTSDYGYCYWWLRSPGNTQADAAGVLTTEGNIHEAGNDVNNPENAIRPVMWIELDI